MIDAQPHLYVTFRDGTKPTTMGQILVAHDVRAVESYHGSGEAPVHAGDETRARRVAAALIALYEVTAVRIA